MRCARGAKLAIQNCLVRFENLFLIYVRTFHILYGLEGRFKLATDRGAFCHVQHVQPNRGPTNRGPHKRKWAENNHVIKK